MGKQRQNWRDHVNRMHGRIPIQILQYMPRGRRSIGHLAKRLLETVSDHIAATIFQFIILMFVYSSICFGHFPAHHQKLNDGGGSLWFYLRIVVTVVLCSWSGWPAGPTTNTARLSPRYAGKTRGYHCSH